MTHLDFFIEKLKEKQVSAATVKNYRADIKKFISWYEAEFHEDFSPTRISGQIVQLYKNYLLGKDANTHGMNINLSQNNSNPFGINSIKRYESSLRSYFHFLAEEHVIEKSPVTQEKRVPQRDLNGILAFKNYLYGLHVSPFTVKNYLHDINQFINWLHQVIHDTSGSEPQEETKYITEEIVEEYKKRLIYDKKLSPVSVNRKLSSLRRFTSWAYEFGYIKTLPSSPIRNITREVPKGTPVIPDSLFTDTLVPITTFEQTPFNKPQKTKEASRFGPLRIARKLSTLISQAIDLSLIPLFLKGEATWEMIRFLKKGQTVFDKVPLKEFSKAQKSPTPVQGQQMPGRILPRLTNISKEFYAPLTTTSSGWKKALYIIRHKRPLWYKKYHNHPLSHYLHFALLMLSLSIMAYFFMDASGFASWRKSLALATKAETPHVLSYTGLLKDSKNNPITTPTNIRFSIYSDQSTSESGSLWQESQTVTPRSDGSFTTTLGRYETLSDSVFHNPSLYLGVSVAGGKELRPRQEIATVDLAKSADTLQGMGPITTTNDPRNSILALNSAGNLSITGAENTVFETTDGQFTLSGQSVLLTSSAGSNGNIVIKPDGTGFIDVQKPIQNTSEDIGPSGLTGAVEVQDILAISATSSAQPALYINQNGTSPIISAVSGGIAKFSLKSDGTAFFSGNVGIGTITPFTTLDVNGTLRATHIGINTLPDGVYSLTASGPIRATGFVGDQLRTSLSDSPTLVKLLIDAPASQSADLAEWQIQGTTIARITASGNLGLGTDQPSEKLTVSGNIGLKGNLLLLDGNRTISSKNGQTITLGDDQSGNILFNPNGKIGVGTNSPFAKLQVSGGGLCVGENSDCNGIANASGTIYAANTTVQHTDVAEDYPTNDQSLSPGDVVALDENTGVFVTKASPDKRNLLLGVVSTQPGVHLGGIHSKEFASAKQVPVGLSGRVPVKVNLDGGPIHIGDPLTLSSTPGVAKKATGTGMILGIALTAYTDTSSSGTVLLFINKTWYDPNTYITDTGDVHGISLTPSPGQSGNRVIDSLISALQETVKTTTLVADTIIVDGKDLTAFITDTIGKLPTLSTPHLITPIADIGKIRTNIISPLANDPQSIALTFAKKSIQVTHGTSTVAQIDSAGNASFSGRLTAQNLESTDASITGTLQVKHLIANQIDGLATQSAQYITNVTNIYSATPAASDHTVPTAASKLAQAPLSSDTIPIASLAGVLAYTPRLEQDYQTITKGFMVYGPTSLSDTSIAGQLSVNGSMILSDNSLNVLGADVAFQPLRQGGISFEGGMLAISTDGDLTVNGNAVFAKNVSVSGTLAAHVISPLPHQDLTVQLGDASSLQVKNASNSGVVEINGKGDIHASGSGTFTEILAHGLSIVRSAQADTSLTETVASSSAGTATITAGHLERTVYSPFVTATSLIYITPTSDTGNVIPYLARQTADNPGTATRGSFTISIPQITTHDSSVNWVIVN